MDKINKIIYYNKLFEIYKGLLTHKQCKIFVDYYGCDLSLSEVANINKISRAAVDDSLQKTCKKLDEFETKLHILEQQLKISEIIEKMRKKSSNLEELDKIEELIKHGI